MKYIYDIMLNFDEKFYDFFEWNDSDNIEYIKKIPAFKLSNKVLNELKNNEVIINNFINIIKDKTEVYLNTTIDLIEYSCLFVSDNMVIAVEFNNEGKIIYKSDLLIDEALDVISVCDKLKEIKLDYKILKKNTIDFMTKEELKKYNFICREIEKLYLDNNIEKLRYLYYECYNKVKNVSRLMLIDLKKYEISNKLYDLLMLNYLNK